MMSTNLGNLVVSSSPHIKTTTTISSAMRDVIIALTPALIVSLYYYRWASLSVILVSIISAVLSNMFFKRQQIGK